MERYTEIISWVYQTLFFPAHTQKEKSGLTTRRVKEWSFDTPKDFAFVYAKLQHGARDLRSGYFYGPLKEKIFAIFMHYQVRMRKDLVT